VLELSNNWVLARSNYFSERTNEQTNRTLAQVHMLVHSNCSCDQTAQPMLETH
jgi:hypothetical protein